jgi:RNA recognition motif-containing protein
VKKLFVANLPFGGLTVEDLRAHFAQCGEVIDVQLRRDRNHMPSYGFVTYAREEDARRALVTMQRTILDGRALDIQVAARQA